MRRTLILCAGALLIAAPASADHKNGKHAKVSRAQIAANEAATAAGIPDARGRAHLVDGRKKNKVSLHMKGLAPGETYLWHVHQATAEGDPCVDSAIGNPAPYPGWEYRELTANESGNANSKGRSSTFPVAAEEDVEGDYYVNVHLEDGTVIACGVLERKGHSKRGAGDDSGQGAEGKAKARGHGRPDKD
jgi:hypothetical protein